MAVFGSLQAVRSQLAQSERFAPALACVEQCLRDGSQARRRLFELAPGETQRLELEGGAFALLQVYLTRPEQDCRWETHKVYADVQALVFGQELMETADAGRLELQEDLTPDKDVVFYRPFRQGSALRLSPGAAAVFFPADGHRGCIALDAPELVRKVVVKVPAGGAPA